MFGMGMGELIIILVVALLALGPEKLPDAAKKIGQTIRGLRRQTTALRRTIEEDTHLGDAMREIRSALNEDPVAKKPPKPVATADESDDAEADADAASDDAPKIEPATDAVARDSADVDDEPPATNGSATTAEGALEETPMSEYEKYIHMWGAQAAADKYGTSVEHAEATLKATQSRGQSG